MPISLKQAERIKAIIDNDANIVSEYLQVKGLDYAAFESKFSAEYKQRTGLGNDFAAYDAFLDELEDAWANEIGDKLTPENITGACVIGGLAIAASPLISLTKLWETNAESINNLDELADALRDYYGLNYEELYDLQEINDKYPLTDDRRIALKQAVDSFVVNADVVTVE